MQQPTLRNVRIRSTRDAIAVFYGVARNAIPLITRRLDAEERLCITAGTVFVWEENANSEASGLGMDGRNGLGSQSGSRCKLNLEFNFEFLFYHQKESDIGEETVNPVTPWAQMMRKRSNRFPGSFSLSPKKAPDSRLIKQTFSVLVSLPKDRPSGTIRKWHLTAYFNQETLNELDTIDDLRLLDAPVPEGWFRSARATKARRENRGVGDLPEGMLSSPTSDHPLPMPFNSTPAAQTRYRGQVATTPKTAASSPSSIAIPVPLKPTPRHPAFMQSPITSTAGLVPLEYLENTSQKNRRNPTDEQLLRRFV
ncbi:hypothetical protein C8F01DRAFT_1086259 [Mycena amicta]|nr:hypothetical protein C8F01DRAFT_1086259 [Mycena amicta]